MSERCKHPAINDTDEGKKVEQDPHRGEIEAGL